MSTQERADVVAELVLGVPGVAGLHPGMFGEVGTYLPGRRVAGIRFGDDTIAVHIAIRDGADARETAAAVRAAVSRSWPGVAVDVTVEDVVSDD
jgi:hypothetical protein